MPLFYGKHSDTRMWGFVAYDEQQAGEIYVKHYRKYLILDYLSKNLDTLGERREAIDEINHCEKVLLKWKLHPNWIENEVLPHIERLKKLSIDELIEEYAMTSE